MLGLTYSGFGLGYLLGLGISRAAVAIVASDECGGFGHTRPENCPAVRSTSVGNGDREYS